jgi:hypothetical protein
VLVATPVVSLVVGILSFIGCVWVARIQARRPRPDDERVAVLEALVAELETRIMAQGPEHAGRRRR